MDAKNKGANVSSLQTKPDFLLEIEIKALEKTRDDLDLVRQELFRETESNKAKLQELLDERRRRTLPEVAND